MSRWVRRRLYRAPTRSSLSSTRHSSNTFTALQNGECRETKQVCPVGSLAIGHLQQGCGGGGGGGWLVSVSDRRKEN
jgi:hypothetical protein